MGLDDFILTKAAFVLCAQLGIADCNHLNLSLAWLQSGGMCGKVGCHYTLGCPNDFLCTEPQTDECTQIANYGTVGDLEAFKRDGTLNGPGGKAYVCAHKSPAPCVGDPNKECATIY